MSPGNEQNKPPPRPWHRLHRSTWVVCALLIVSLTLIVVPGEEMTSGGGSTAIFSGGDKVFHSGYSTWTKYDHGWPFVYLHRTDRFNPNWRRPPWLFSDGWMLLRGAKKFNGLALAADAFISAAVTICTVVVYELWRRRRRRLWSFSIKELLFVCLAAAVILAWVTYHQRRGRQEAALIEWFEAQPCVHVVGDDYFGPLWLARLVGRDRLGYFRRAVRVELKADAGLERELLETVSRLCKFRDLQKVQIRVEDEALEKMLRDSPVLDQVPDVVWL